MNVMSPFKSLRMPVENIIRFHLVVNGANEVSKDIKLIMFSIKSSSMCVMSWQCWRYINQPLLKTG